MQRPLAHLLYCLQYTLWVSIPHKPGTQYSQQYSYCESTPTVQPSVHSLDWRTAQTSNTIFTKVELHSKYTSCAAFSTPSGLAYHTNLEHNIHNSTVTVKVHLVYCLQYTLWVGVSHRSGTQYSQQYSYSESTPTALPSVHSLGWRITQTCNTTFTEVQLRSDQNQTAHPMTY